MQGEDAALEPARVYRGEQLAAGRAVVGPLAVVGLEVDGHHVPRANVREDIERLARIRVSPAIDLALFLARRDGDERELDPGEPLPDLVEHARIVTGVPGEEDAMAESLDHVSRVRVVPEGIEAVAAALVADGHCRDPQYCRFNRLPGRQ